LDRFAEHELIDAIDILFHSEPIIRGKGIYTEKYKHLYPMLGERRNTLFENMRAKKEEDRKL
jgi:hypothetical protein